MIAYIIMAMLFCHVLDDFKIQQGVLANMKQKVWWENNAPDKLYKYDYIVALCMHSVSWSFMILLPVAMFYSFHVDAAFVIAFVLNTAIHAVVDDMKANKGIFTLVIDQLIHLAQITCTAIILL